MTDVIYSIDDAHTVNRNYKGSMRVMKWEASTILVGKIGGSNFTLPLKSYDETKQLAMTGLMQQVSRRVKDFYTARDKFEARLAAIG